MEHLCNLYASQKNRGLLINRDKFEELKDEIYGIINKTFDCLYNEPVKSSEVEQRLREILNNFYNKTELKVNESEWRSGKDRILETLKELKVDILIEGYDEEKINEKIWNDINNFPSIRTLIELLLEDIEFKRNERIDLIINCMYEIRNHFVHNSINLETLYEKLNSEFDASFDFNGIIKILDEFEKFLEELTFKIVGINKSLIKTSNFKTTHIYNRYSAQGKSRKEYFISLLEENLSELKNHNNYFNLFRFLLRQINNFEENYKDFTYSGLSYPKKDINEISERSIINEISERSIINEIPERNIVNEISNCNIRFDDKNKISAIIKGSMQVYQSFSIEFKNLEYNFESILIFDAIAKGNPLLQKEYEFRINVKDVAYCFRQIGYIHLAKLENYKKAIQYFKKALELEPKEPSSFYNFACAHSILDNKQNALSYLRKAIDLNPEKYTQFVKEAESFANIRDMSEFKKLLHIQKEQ